MFNSPVSDHFLLCFRDASVDKLEKSLPFQGRVLRVRGPSEVLVFDSLLMRQ